MFSLPSALPAPPGDYQAATSYKSDTATQAFPTLQTVTSPENFRQRGDWGFKRHFPLRSTARTSTPYLRIKQVDSIEHVTDYSSAADHSLTLEKFQEMNVAMSLPHPKVSTTEGARQQRLGDTNKSVFEDQYDFTVLDEDKIIQAGRKRWKYKGPWLANLPEGEFQTYIKKQVRGRRSEFREFLKVQLAPRLTREARARAMEEGIDQEVSDLQPEQVTDEQIMDFLRDSREEGSTRRDLYNYVSKFLDLAPCPREKIDYVYELAHGQSEVFTAEDPYSATGPPVTHPSAGLSYLRTNAFLENHPVYGPQSHHRPVKARVMSMQPGIPLVGVGGIVSNAEPARSAFKTSGMDLSSHKEPGGPKMWINVSTAHVNSIGQAVMHCVEASMDGRMIEEEMQGERRLYHAQSEASAQAHLGLKGSGSIDDFEHARPKESRTMRRASNQFKHRVGGSADYGLTQAPSPTSVDGGETW